MAQNEYRPVSWNGEPITNDKLNQMSNNTQFLFERTPRIRYSGIELTRDTGVKIIGGKTPYPVTPATDWVSIPVLFGSFFTAGSRPAITATVESPGSNIRKWVSMASLAGGEIDHTGFIAHVWQEKVQGLPYNIYQSGWVHWTAVGY